MLMKTDSICGGLQVFAAVTQRHYLHFAPSSAPRPADDTHSAPAAPHFSRCREIAAIFWGEREAARHPTHVGVFLRKSSVCQSAGTRVSG